MKFKILPGSKLFDDLQELVKRGRECNTASKAWIDQNFPECKRHCSPYNCIFGGISALELDHKPTGWMVYGKAWQGLYTPKASQKKLWAEWAKLPVVKEIELKDLLGYGNYSGAKDGGIAWSTMPAFVPTPDFILIQTSEVATTYVPKPGMIEILESEYNALYEAHKNAKKTELLK